MKHTESCLKAQSARDEYLKKWPGVCKRCLGSGILHDRGDRDTPPSDDLCSCVESGVCPRCGTSGLEHYEKDSSQSWGTVYMEDHDRCQSCGWSDEDENMELCPDADCYCWESESQEDALQARILDLQARVKALESEKHQLQAYLDQETQSKANRKALEDADARERYWASQVPEDVRSILDIRRDEAFAADDDDDPVWDEETDYDYNNGTVRA